MRRRTGPRADSRAPDACAACPETLDGLRRYHHWELLRIGTCDLIGLLDLTTVTAQLSQLADSVIWVCLELLARSLGMTTEGFVVLGMGKLGGRELNYSSDVDLLFLADGDVAAFQRLGERLIKALTEATSEGFLYRVDMRLRPWGRVGPLISTVDGYLTYLARDARLWEKQALLRARVVAGDEPVGTGFLRRADPLLFSAGAERRHRGPDAVRAEVHAMKQLTEAQLRQADRIWGDVKLGEGSIRDAEFVAQYLQLAHGKSQPELRTGHTLEALARLGENGYLRSDEYRVLVDGYTFLRTVEHYLQILDYRQTHTLPADPADLRYLARRLGFTGPSATDRFVAHLRQHGAAIRAVYLHHLDPMAESGPPTQRGVATMNQDPLPDSPDLASPFNPQSEIARHLARLSPSYAATFSRAEIAFHAELAARLNDRNPVEIAAEHIEEGYWRVTIVAHDYLGELSLICGLLFAHGLSIVDGHVYTYEAVPADKSQPADVAVAVAAQRTLPVDPRRKIVDVFTVKHVMAEGAADIGAKWRSYATDLAALLRLLEGGRQREAQGELAKRVALAVRGVEAAAPTLHPIDIAIRSDPGERYTRLQIESQDTPGFLYEFTNALALNGIHIAQVSVATEGNRVRDILHVTDARGRRITSPERQRELRAATVLVKHFTHLLPQSPNPELALHHFNEYLAELFARPSWPDELASLERPEVLSALARLLGVSDFLWDDFLRMQYANLFPVVHDVDALATGKTRSQLTAELAAELATAPDAAARCDRLNAFKDREMFRIDMRQILGQIPAFGQFSAELTDLAEVIVDATMRFCMDELLAVHGEPRTDGGGAGAALCRGAGQVRRAGAGFRVRHRADVRIRRGRGDDRPEGHQHGRVLREVGGRVHARDPGAARGHLRDRSATAALRQSGQPRRVVGRVPPLLRARRVRPGPTSGRRWSSCGPSPGMRR